MHSADGSVETVRLRLRLIGSSPEVYGWGHAQLEEARAVLENAVLKHGAPPMRAKAVSAAILMQASLVLATS